MQQSNFCFAAGCAKKALNEAVCAIVSASALEQYAELVQKIKEYTHFDLEQFFHVIALLAVICWIKDWLSEVCDFLTRKVPRFFHKLLHGEVSLCLLDCEDSESTKSSKSRKSSSSFHY